MPPKQAAGAGSGESPITVAADVIGKSLEKSKEEGGFEMKKQWVIGCKLMRDLLARTMYSMVISTDAHVRRMLISQLIRSSTGTSGFTKRHVESRISPRTLILVHSSITSGTIFPYPNSSTIITFSSPISWRQSSSPISTSWIKAHNQPPQRSRPCRGASSPFNNRKMVHRRY